MSKSLEALIDLSQQHKISLTEEHRIECYKVIEKELKSLEIIKEKLVDIGWLIRSENYSKYNLGVGSSQALKRNEYNLLKEVLL